MEEPELLREVDCQIAEGRFRWALHQNRTVHGTRCKHGTHWFSTFWPRGQKWWVWFAGVLAGDEFLVTEESKSLLSILMLNTAYALESSTLLSPSERPEQGFGETGGGTHPRAESCSGTR